MRPLRASEIRGTWATLLLPVDASDGIDYSRLADEIDILLASGCDGIYSNGTAGEFHTLLEDEFDRIAELLAARCERAGVPFQIGVSHMSGQISRERLRRAVALRPSAVQVILPDWYPVTLEEAEIFLTTMGEIAGGIGLVLYNPPHAKRRLLPEELGRLAQAVPDLVGAKLAGGDAAWYAAMQPVFQRLSVFIPGHALATGILHGAHGSYSNVACLHPGGAKRWNELIYRDPVRALEIESRIVAFMRDHILPFRERDGYSNTALDKLLAAIGGWAPIGTRVRWPYCSVPTEEATRLREIARRQIPELFSASL